MFAAVASYCEVHEDKAAVHEDKADIKQEGKGNKKRKKRQGLLYKELKQRVHRCKELERVASKMRTRKNVMVSQQVQDHVLNLVNRAKVKRSRLKVTVIIQSHTSGNKKEKNRNAIDIKFFSFPNQKQNKCYKLQFISVLLPIVDLSPQRWLA